MAADLFGKLKYRHEEWVGYVALPQFAEYGSRPAEPEMTEEEAGAAMAETARAMEAMKERMRGQIGPASDRVFAALDAEIAQLEADGTYNAAGEERDRKRAARAIASSVMPTTIAPAPPSSARPGRKRLERYFGADLPS